MFTHDSSPLLTRVCRRYAERMITVGYTQAYNYPSPQDSLHKTATDQARHGSEVLRLKLTNYCYEHNDILRFINCIIV